MKGVEGNNIIYHYLQKYLPGQDEAFFKSLVQRFIIDLSIWWPVELYKELPILLPYVKRDNHCRKAVGGVEEWGMPDEAGLLRDDNTLIKDIPGALLIKSKKILEYNGRRMSSGFVASHIWQKYDKSSVSKSHASGDPVLNSFIPNLVWLPVQLSKLSDREKSYAQNVLKTISRKLYFDSSDTFSKEVWKKLPKDELTSLSFSTDELNFFDVERKWLEKYKKRLSGEINFITRVDKYPLEKLPKVKSSRYLVNLKKISKNRRRDLNERLIDFRERYLSD